MRHPIELKQAKVERLLKQLLAGRNMIASHA